MENKTQPMTQPMYPQQLQSSSAQMTQSPFTTPKPCEDTQGILPACAPLANPYVPFQQNNPQTYPAKKGVVRGTLFPGLDLPFMGMVNKEELSPTHLHELQALAFSIGELGQYLDTHPDDTEVLELMHSYAEMYEKAVTQYQSMHGPLTQRNGAKSGSYNWLNDPWPWDYAANTESTKED